MSDFNDSNLKKVVLLENQTTSGIFNDENSSAIVKMRDFNLKRPSIWTSNILICIIKNKINNKIKNKI